MSQHPVARAAASVGAAAGLATLAVIGSASMASANTTVYTNNNCGLSATQFFDTDLCSNSLLVSYHQNGDGTDVDFTGNVPNYTSQTIGGVTDIWTLWDYAGGSTDGYGQTPRNNCAYAYNLSSVYTYTVYVSPNSSGHAQSFGPNSGANFDTTLRNNEASQSVN
jgi:hypothetical protein